MSSRLAQRKTFDHKAEPASPSHELVHFLLLPPEQGLSRPPPAEPRGLPDHLHSALCAPTDMPSPLTRQRSRGPAQSSSCP